MLPILEEWGVDPYDILVRADWQILTPFMQLRIDSLDTLYSRLQAYFPNEILGIRSYIDSMQTVITWLKKTFLPHPLLLSSRQQAKVLLSVLGSPILSAKVGRLFLTSTPEYLSAFFTDRELIRILDAPGYPHMPAVLHAGMWYLFTEDYWLPKGGLGAFMTRISRLFSEAGGTIVCQTPVERIVVKQGKACGVKLKSGEVIGARHIVSSIDYNHTYQSLLENTYVPSRFLRQIAARRPSESYITLSLVTDTALKTMPSLNAVHTFYYPERDFPRGLILSLPGVRDEELAKQKGLQLVYISLQCTKGLNLAKTREMLIKAVAKLLPGLEEHILACEYWYPGRYEQEFNAYGGASAGWNLLPLHMLRYGFPGYMSPIANLYHASQWAYSPGGVPAAMLSARQASMKIIHG
jgi:phytoene dehydrogenase-like protein